MKMLHPDFIRTRDFTVILCLVALAGCGLKTGYAPTKVTVHRGTAAMPVSALAPGDSIRVVSWNIQYGEDVVKAIGEIRANPDLLAADIIRSSPPQKTVRERGAVAMAHHQRPGAHPAP